MTVQLAKMIGALRFREVRLLLPNASHICHHPRLQRRIHYS
jgi:hypothetical protein